MEPDIIVSDAEKKSVLFISPQPYFQWRGSPIRVSFDVRAIAESGYGVDLLALPFGEEKQIDGVSVVRTGNPFGAKNVSIGPSLLKAFFDVLLFFKAWGMHRRSRYDVVHCVEDAGLIGAFLSAIYGIKFVFEKHSDPASYKKGILKNVVLSIYGAMERHCVRKADAVICTGSGLARQARDYGTKAQVHDIGDIPSSLEEADASKLTGIRDGWGVKPADVVACYVGSFAVYQGVDLLFESFVKAAGKNEHLKLVIIGGSEKEISGRKAWLRDKGCDAAVVFAGYVAPDELASQLAAADILLSPRISGVNTPLKLLDYLKAGRAILAADTQANKLILNENIAVFAAPDAESMAGRLCALALDSGLREKIGAAGRKLIDEKYNYTVFKDAVAAVYRGVLQS